MKVRTLRYRTSTSTHRNATMRRSSSDNAQIGTTVWAAAGGVSVKRDTIGAHHDRGGVDQERYALKVLHRHDHREELERERAALVGVVDVLRQQSAEHDG